MKKILTFCLLAITFISPVFAADILSDSDAEIYTKIFALTRTEKHNDAKNLESEIKDNLLMSDVLHTRYMSKTYRTSGAELAAWLTAHNTKPGADNMHKMALKRNVKSTGAKLPRTIHGSAPENAQNEAWTTKKYTGDAAANITKFRNALRRGNTKNARELLESAAFKRQISTEDYGRLAGRLGFIYYTNAEFELARRFAQIGADAKSEYGHWTLGLMSFKDGNFRTAEKHFMAIVDLPQINQQRKTEVTFWAGRSALFADDLLSARRHWMVASAHPSNFYGALANAALGTAPRYEFFATEMTDSDIRELSATDYGRSALALLQINEPVLAEQHLRLLITSSASDRLLHAVHALANSAELPRTAMQVSGVVRDRGILEIDSSIITAAQYPMPDWEPMGGWSIDRALLFAITRQESGFRPNAQSNKGATGVMQLMPRTARSVAASQNVKMSDIDMKNPEHNMFLGQQYIVDILNLPAVDGSIIKMLVAYNAGQGAMARWERQFQTDDPLLFIESFPAKESRDYVRRVMANLWLYRARLGQPNPSMRELANGQWPRYETSDKFVIDQIAERNII
ncbi:MAG: lytic transglycosylase domain-containing protein [Alphaproteobacteria bacterium]|nr:lytic transglycosylase domain-containing protein [Alphaproteobacteria bacterium]MCL2890245.1 lytic transglycosylase domain-containing protein [Alphaproteobacteria bacterium]